MEPCAHPDPPVEGRCPRCGACLHDVVLNRSCLTCGEVDPVVTNKPSTPATVVPAERLRRRPTS